MGSVAAVLAARRWWQQSGGSVLVAAWRRQRGSGGSVAAARRREAWRWCWQRGGGGAGSTPTVPGLAAAAEIWRHRNVSGGSRAAGAALPLRTASVATKTLAVTAMAGELPTINNQIKAAAAMAMETTTTTTNKTQATAAAAAAWWQPSIGVGGSAVVAVCHQCGGSGQQRGANVPPLHHS